MRPAWRYLIPTILLAALLAGCQSVSTNAGRCRLLGDSPDDAQEWNRFEFHAAHSTVRFCLPESWEEVSPQDIPKNDKFGQDIEYFAVYDPGPSHTSLEEESRAAVWLWEDPTFFDPQQRGFFNHLTLAEVAKSRLRGLVALAEEAAWAQMVKEPNVVIDEQDFAVATLVLRMTNTDDTTEILKVDMYAYAATPYTAIEASLSINGMYYQPGDEEIFEKFLSTLSVEEPE